MVDTGAKSPGCSVCVCVCARSVAQSCPILCDPMGYARLIFAWDSLGKNTGVGCHLLLQGICSSQFGDRTHIS